MTAFARKQPSSRRLMIVEDDALIAFDCEHALAMAGFEIVATVNDGEDAMAMLTREPLDLVLLDFNLAGAVTGYEVAKLACGLAVPVLFVTGECPRNAQAYAQGWLSKPFRAHDLLGAIGAVDRALEGLPVNGTVPGLTLFDQSQLDKAELAANSPRLR